MVILKSYSIFVVDHQLDHRDQFQEVFAAWPHLVQYCTSVEEARGILQGVLADVLICNLRTPGVVEEDFLGFIQERCPHAVRIVFADEEDTVSLMKTVAMGRAHRYFRLPWEQHAAAAILSGDLLTRSRMRVRKCWRFLQEGAGMPVLPSVVQEMEAVLADPDYSLDEVVKVLEKEPVIAVRLLRVVNSAAYAKVRSIDNLHHAITYLGMSDTRQIVLFLCASIYFRYPRRYHRLALRIISHSLQCSKLASLIAEELIPGRERTAATAGLLHDLGKLVLLAALAHGRHAGLALPTAFYGDASRFEEKTFGITHQELGGSMMLWWNLPLAIVEAAASHAMPLAQLRGVTRCVAIADRCLQVAEQHGLESSDLASLREQLPVDEWLAFASRLLTAP